MRPDLIAANESSLAAHAELTRVHEPGMPGVDERTVVQRIRLMLSRDLLYPACSNDRHLSFLFNRMATAKRPSWENEASVS